MARRGGAAWQNVLLLYLDAIDMIGAILVRDAAAQLDSYWDYLTAVTALNGAQSRS